MIIYIGGDFFGKNLVYLRKKYRISRRAVAKLAGISAYTLEGIEKGVLYPELKAEVFQRLCEIFHVDSNQLTQTDLTVTP